MIHTSVIPTDLRDLLWKIILVGADQTRPL